MPDTCRHEINTVRVFPAWKEWIFLLFREKSGNKRMVLFRMQDVNSLNCYTQGNLV